MKQAQLIPKPPRRMKQKRKDVIRREREVALAEAAYLRTPHWWRAMHRIRARLLETDKQTAAEQAALENGNV